MTFIKDLICHSSIFRILNEWSPLTNFVCEFDTIENKKETESSNFEKQSIIYESIKSCKNISNGNKCSPKIMLYAWALFIYVIPKYKKAAKRRFVLEQINVVGI